MIDLFHTLRAAQKYFVPEMLIIQNSPYYWMNMQQRGPFQELKYWNAANTSKFMFIPNDSTKQFFTILREWAAAPRSNSFPLTHRPERITSQFIPNDFPVHWRLFSARIRSYGRTTIMVADRRNTDYSNVSNVVMNFDTVVKTLLEGGKDTKNLTHWAEFSDIVKVINSVEDE